MNKLTKPKSDFTIISKNIMRNKNVSLKAKGLYALMVGLPDTWNFSAKGLAEISKESTNTVNSILKELEKAGYLFREKIVEHGKFVGINYILFNQPLTNFGDMEKPLTKKPHMENTFTENCVIYKESTNKELNNRVIINNTEKKSFGEFGNVKLTAEEEQAVLKDYGNDFNKAIELLDDYIETHGKKYKSHRAVLKKSGWVFDKVKNKKTVSSSYIEPEYEEPKQKPTSKFVFDKY